MSFEIGIKLPTGPIVERVLLGGMSEVAIAKAPGGGDVRYAVKRLRDDVLETLTSELAAEARESFEAGCTTGLVLSQRKVPYIAATIYAAEDDRYGLYKVSEFVDGPSLSALLATRPVLSLTETVRIVRQTAEALAGAHQGGHVHGDLKPSNILLTRGNEVRVIDWDLGGFPGGVPIYVSPHRRADPSQHEPPDDVWALGVIMHQCLVGKPYEHHGGRPSLPPLRFGEVITATLIAALAPLAKERLTAERMAEQLSDKELDRVVRALEYQRPYCEVCGFVDIREDGRSCVVCRGQMRRRVARPCGAGMVRVERGFAVRGMQEHHLKNAAQAGGVDTGPVVARYAEPLRRDFVDAFDIDETPVTNDEFGRFVDATGWPPPVSFLEFRAGRPDHPVVNVSWTDALAYAIWRNCRLPKGEEWEKAARGDQDDRPFPWGDQWDNDKCNHGKNARSRFTTSVREFEGGKSPYGVWDLAGNVKEWVGDVLASGFKVVRGGGWQEEGPVAFLVTRVRKRTPSTLDGMTGFRCAADVEYDEDDVSDG